MDDAATLRRLRDKLDAREAELQAEVLRLTEEPQNPSSSVTTHDTVEDLGEQGEQRISGAIRYAEKERDQLELRDIEAARGRMAAGTYGVCTDCGVEIALSRLEVQPAAARCLPCQERFERTHGAGPRVPPVL